MEREASGFVLPPLVVGMADIMRLKRELEALADYLHQAALRHTAEVELKLPKTSRVLDELIKTNKLDLLDRVQFEQTLAELVAIEQKAPQIHLSFSSDPSSAFIVRVVEWLRQNVHPGVLVQIGLQPTLAAGCIVRTTNKQFDLSLKRHFEAARPVLIQKMHEGIVA